MNLNERIYEALHWLFSVIEKLGIWISILAWVSVLLATIFMGVVLRKHSMQKIWLPALVIGCVSLLAHLLDYFVTLHVSANLVEEGNPLWRIVIDNFGLNIAKAYGLSGKLFLAILSFEFFAYYLICREWLFPKQANSFFSFWRKFGMNTRSRLGVCWKNVVNFFSFAFALIGPFMFYIVILNSLIDDPVYYKLPPMPFVLLLYLGLLVMAYLVFTYRAFCSKSS